MRPLYIVCLFFFLIVGSCDRSFRSTEKKNHCASFSASKTIKQSIALRNLFTLKDAEKILGEPAHLMDSSTTQQKNVLMYSCAYQSNATDPKTNKTGSVYFLIEQYDEISAAHNKFTDIKTANEKGGIKTLYELGDEAYFHSDGENFYFIMVRKGTRVFNMKVNKITSKTSLEEFNRVSKEITEAM